MRNPAHLVHWLWSRRNKAWFRYGLPFGGVATAMFCQLAVMHLVRRDSDFPFPFFYLVAVFASAWMGGYAPGVIGVLLTMVGLPLAVTPGFRLSSVDLSRLTLFAGISALVSAVANGQRRIRQQLAAANEELDARVAERTRELAGAVYSLELEVAERRKTERALRESEQRVDLTLDAAHIGRWDLDLVTGRILRSLRHDQIYGYDELLPEWTVESVVRHLHEEDRQLVAGLYRNTLASGDTWEFDARIVRHDGEVRWVWIQAKILRDESGRAVRMLGSIRDISERKAAEAKLRAQLARLNLLDHITRGIGERHDLHSIFQVVVRSLEDSLPVDFGCVGVYDPAANRVKVTCVGARSAELARTLALTEQAYIDVNQNGLARCLRGQLVYEPDVSALDFPFPRLIASGGLRSLVAAPLTVDNGVFGVLIAARRPARAFDSGECEFLRQLSDHTALAVHQAQTRDALQQAYDELQRSQQAVLQQERLRALGQMASGIAHDINNALSPVALYTEALLGSEPNLSERTRQYLETMQRAIEDVSETVARMREFYRQQGPQLVLSPVQLGPLVRQVLELTRARWSDMAQQAGATICALTEVAPALPAIHGIESEIREALTNLILNAVDAMPKGGVLTVRALEARRDGMPQVHLEVSDTGHGMDEDTRRRCLEPFFTTKGERGTGLGLAMVYGTAKRHRAEVEIESGTGRGTTARIVFPAAESPAAEPSAPGPEFTPSALNLLIVDDDPMLIQSLRDTLEAEGHTVTTANGGGEGIRIVEDAQARNERFSAVITDLGMPHVDGRKVARVVKETSPATPVILLTGWGQRLVADGEVPPFVDRVLSKPPRLRHLRAALAEVTAGVPELAVQP